MLTDFHNSFADRLASKFAIKSTLNISPHFIQMSLHYLVKYQSSKMPYSRLNKSNCHVRLSYSKSLLKYTCIVMIPLFNSVIKILLAAILHVEISHHWLYATVTTKKRCRGKKPHLTSGRSVADNVNLSVSKSNWSTASSYLLTLKSELLCL